MKADGEVDNGRSNLDKVLNKHLLMNKLKKQNKLNFSHKLKLIHAYQLFHNLWWYIFVNT